MIKFPAIFTISKSCFIVENLYIPPIRKSNNYILYSFIGTITKDIFIQLMLNCYKVKSTFPKAIDYTIRI